jgi:hypothetical protein
MRQNGHRYKQGKNYTPDLSNFSISRYVSTNVGLSSGAGTLPTNKTALNSMDEQT